MASNLEVVEQFYDAMQGLDTVAMLEALSNSFVGHVSAGLPGGFGGTYTGRDAMLEDCWAPVHARFGAMPHPTQLLVAGPDHVVAVGEYRGQVRATGRTFAAAFVHVLRLVDGRIAELRQVTDTERWGEACSNVGLARRVFDAVRARDLDALLAAYSPDITIRDDPSLPYGGEHHRHEGAIRHSAGFAETWDPYQSVHERDPAEVLLDAGPRVVALWRLRAHHGEHTIDQRTVSVLTVAEGQVVGLDMFHSDTAALLGLIDRDRERTVAS